MATSYPSNLALDQKKTDIASTIYSIFAECSSLIEVDDPKMLGYIMQLDNMLRIIVDTNGLDLNTLNFTHCYELFSSSSSSSSSSISDSSNSMDSSAISDVVGDRNSTKKVYVIDNSTWTALSRTVQKKIDSFRAGLKEESQINMFHENDRKWYEAKIVAIDSKYFTLRYRGFKDPKYNETKSREDTLVYPSGFRVPAMGSGKKMTFQFALGRSQNSCNESQVGGGSSSSSSSSSAFDSVESPIDSSAILTKSGRVVKKSSAVPRYSTMKEEDIVKYNPQREKAIVAATAADGSKKKERVLKRKDRTEEDDNDWLCGVCGLLATTEDNSLIACDGLCKRSFHSGCLELSPEKVDQLLTCESWYCRDCIFSEHNCYLCGKLGLDYVDVFKCQKDACGKYYHISCLEKDSNFVKPKINKEEEGPKDVADNRHLRETHNLCIDFPWNNSKTQNKSKRQALSPAASNLGSPTRGVSSSSSSVAGSYIAGSSSSRTKTIRHTNYTFSCPFHTCDTCGEFYQSSKGKCIAQRYSISSLLFPCIKCPRAFHINCIPPGSRYNPDFLMCPDHPGAYLPSTKVLDPKARAAAAANNSKNMDFFWEQMVLPDKTPDPDDLYGTHFRLPTEFREDVKQQSSEFKIIKILDLEYLKSKNMTIPVSKMSADEDDEMCQCEGVCDDNCMNRSVKVECNDNNCCVGSECGNRNFAQRNYIKNEKFREFKMGWGLRSLQFVPKGTLIIEYIGEVIDGKEVFRRMTDQRKYTPSDQDFYIMELGQGLFVDGKFKGNVSRFINHSCDPNCELERWEVDGKVRIGIFAVKDIDDNEALSYDYQFDTQEADIFKCYCGKEKCRGTMAPKKREEKCMGILGAYSDSFNIPTGEFHINDSTGRCEMVEEIISSDKLTNRDRAKLANEGRKIALKFEQDMKDAELEKQRSWVSKVLPGDAINEIKSGPPIKQYGLYGRDHHLFLPRNAKAASNILKRRRNMWLSAPNFDFVSLKDDPTSRSSSSSSSSFISTLEPDAAAIHRKNPQNDLISSKFLCSACTSYDPSSLVSHAAASTSTATIQQSPKSSQSVVKPPTPSRRHL